MGESITVRGRMPAKIEPDEWWTSKRSTLGGRVEEGVAASSLAPDSERLGAREGVDRHPALCQLGDLPHDHCNCGLPMASGASRCLTCDGEGVSPVGSRRSRAPDSVRWDGKSYPSRRRRRVGSPDPDGYLALLVAILAPSREAGSD